MGWICFVDESGESNIFAIGGVVIDCNEMAGIIEEWLTLKEKIFGDRSSPMKWSVGKQTKKILKEYYGVDKEEDLLDKYHGEILRKIAEFSKKFQLRLIVCLHEDIRILLRKRHPHDFYETAFRFLLQRLEHLSKEKANEGMGLNMVVIDTPPKGKKQKRQAITEYRKAYFEGHTDGIGTEKPLKGSFIDTIFIPVSDCVGLEIADFLVGAMARIAVDIYKKEEYNKEYAELIKPLFFRSANRGIWMEGLVVFPRDCKLHNLIYEKLNL